VCAEVGNGGIEDVLRSGEQYYSTFSQIGRDSRDAKHDKVKKEGKKRLLP
jgi:hypothetical protein